MMDIDLNTTAANAATWRFLSSPEPRSLRGDKRRFGAAQLG
ncbi:hypothetical protein [Demequina activiva]|uniref:Uncharacterized protein n=1 Tax=Demequina activiva TaxID=1582364 RepID=A0A919UG19_9MICO|nr:hypothetical protein [Demequina activiva]GIG54372.1 hypothetical protein Dac01nite_11240 [Demequina activiva]